MFLTAKEFLWIENGNRYENYQMNNSIKDQIYPKVSHNTTLWADITMQ